MPKPAPKPSALADLPQGWEIKKLEEINNDFLTAFGWSKKSFADLFDIRIGGTPSRSKLEYWDSSKQTQNLWVSIADMKTFVISDTREYISDLGVKKSNVKLIPDGTVLMSFKLTLGKVAIAGKPLYTNEAIAAFYPKLNQILNEFFIYALQDIEFSDVDDAVKGKTLNKEKLRNLELLLPPLFEQQRIASILSSVDALLERSRAVVTQLEEVRRGVMQQLLTRGEYVPLGEIAHEKAGLQTGPFGSQLHAYEYTDAGIPVIMPQDLIGGKILEDKIARIPQEVADRLEKHKLKLGDIIFSRRGNLGRFGLIGTREVGWICGTGCLRFRANKSVNTRYLIRYLQRQDTIDWLHENAVGQTMPNLNTAILASLPVVVAEFDEQENAIKVFDTLEIRERNELEKISQLKCLKKALMQYLLTGKYLTQPVTTHSRGEAL